MKKRVVTRGAYHEDDVAEEVDELQKQGFEVSNIQRKAKALMCGLFGGHDITEITYKEVGK